MSGVSYYPPTNFFQNINFNNDFYAIPNNNQGISLAYANTHYLFSTGVATSTAITTYFSGSIGIGTIGGTAGSLNALTVNAINSIQLNGVDISTIYATSNQLNTAITNTSNYASNINANTSNTLNNKFSLYQLLLTPTTNLLGVGSNITNINYNNITVNPLSFTLPLSKNASNVISIDLSSYLTATQTSNQFLLLSGGTMTGLLNCSNIYNSNLITSSNIYNSNLITTSNLYCSNIAGIGTAINSSYSLSVNTLNVVTSISLSGNRFNTIYQYLINNVVFGGTTGGSGSSAIASGTLTLTMPTNYTGNFSIEGNAGIGTSSSSSSNTLFVNGTSYMSGNVGIGTTPSSTIALTVNGYIVSSNIINNNNIYTSTALAIGTTGGSNLFPYNFNVNGTSYMIGNVGIGTTPSSTIALTVNGALNIISNPTNPGNTTSASFWNQAGIGPTISGLNLSVQTNGTTEAMHINSSGNTYFNGCVGIGTNTINTSYQLQLPYNATYTTQLRCEGGSGTIPLSIGGSGNIYVDAPGIVGGRFTILNGGSVGIGTSNPLTFLDVRGVLYLGGNSGLGTPAFNWGNAGTRIVFWNDSTDVSYSMGMNGATLWYAVPSGTNHIFYVGTTSIATINGSGLSVSGTLTTPQFYTSSTNNIVTNVITIAPTSTSGGPYGNGYWLINVSNYTSQSGFSYLHLNISVPIVPIYWLGRVAISSGGSASYYPDMSYNVQLSFSSGNIQVSSPSGASLALYYRIMG